MKFKNLKEAKDALRAKYDEMKSEEDAEKFKSLNAEFEDIKSEIARMEALDAAEKAFAAEKAVEAKSEEKKAEGYEAAVKSFAAAARKGFNEGTPSAGGYTVPEDIETKIRRLRDAKASLRQLVSVETVKAPSGERTYQKRGVGKGFASVKEGGKIPQTDYPEYARVSYAVEKLGGYMIATNELLEDSDASIANEVTMWFAENARVTDNKLVLATLDSKYTRDESPATPASIASLDDIKKAVNVTLGQAFAPTSTIVTNDDGLQFLDTLKDKDGHSLVKATENNPLDMYLAIGFRRIPLHIVPNADLATNATKGVPFYIGDLKEACRLFDKKGLSILASNTAAVGDVNAFENDLTVWRGLMREDCELLDEEAYVLGYYKANLG